MTNPVDATQLAAATNALLAFIHSEKKDNNNLLEDDAFISIVVTLQRTPEKARTKPFHAPLAHSLYKDRPVCLITCDALYKDVKETLKTTPVEGIEKVLSITKLRKEFGQYADRRKLSSSYDLFLADSRLIFLLPKVIGTKFFEKKKHPTLINLDKAQITPSLTKARDSTYFTIPSGPTISIKIARTSFSDKEIIENFNTAIGPIVDQLPKKWKGVQALYLRTATSVAIPFYHSLPFSLKIQESDTPQLTLQSNSKRKADAGANGSSSKKAALSAPSVSTLTLTEVDPASVETLTPDTPAGLKPKKKLLKRKSLAPAKAAQAATPSPKRAAVAASTPEQAVLSASAQIPATPVLQKKTSLKKTPGTQKKTSLKKGVPSTPAPEATPQTPEQAPATQKKTSLKKSATATPAQQASPRTPGQAPATQKKASLKKGVPATPAPQAAPQTPEQAPATQKKASLKKGVPATPASAATPAAEQAPTTQKKASLKKGVATPAPQAAPKTPEQAPATSKKSSLKKGVPATPAPQATPKTPEQAPTTQKKASLKKNVPATPAPEQAVAPKTPAPTTQKKASQKKSVSATPAPEAVPATPAPAQAQASPAQKKVQTPTSGPKKKGTIKKTTQKKRST